MTKEEMIEKFTQWIRNRKDAITYLELYNWDYDLATRAYYRDVIMMCDYD